MSEDRSQAEQSVSSGSRLADSEASATTAPLPVVEGSGHSARAGRAESGPTPTPPSMSKAATGGTVRSAGQLEGAPREGRVEYAAADPSVPKPDHSVGQTVPAVDPPASVRGAGSNLPPGRAVPRPQRRTGRERQEAKAATRAGARRARLALRRVDPISVFVLSLLVSIFLGVVLLVAVGLLYLLLDRAGVLTSIDTFARELSLIKTDTTILPFNRVATVTGIVAAVDVVVLTVLATLAAVLYNLCASLTGGVEVTLSERE